MNAWRMLPPCLILMVSEAYSSHRQWTLMCSVLPLIIIVIVILLLAVIRHLDGLLPRMQGLSQCTC